MHLLPRSGSKKCSDEEDRRELRTEVKEQRKCGTHLPSGLAVSVFPLPLSLTVSVPVPLAVAVSLPAAFSVIVLMPVPAAGLVASALFSGATVVPFPGTFSPGMDKHHWTVYKGFKVSNTKCSRAISQSERKCLHTVTNTAHTDKK